MTSAIAGWLIALLVAGMWLVHERRRGATRAARIDRLTARVDREIGRWVLAKDRTAEQWLDVIETLEDLQAREGVRARSATALWAATTLP